MYNFSDEEAKELILTSIGLEKIISDLKETAIFQITIDSIDIMHIEIHH